MKKHVIKEQWTGNVVGRMHRYDISQAELAKRCKYAPQYLSSILNGKKEFATEQAKEKAKQNIFYNLRLLEMEVTNEYR